MINRAGDSKAGRIEVPRPGTDRASPAARVGGGEPRARAGGVVSAAADMVAKGPPVDTHKIAAVKAAIAQGHYPVDPIKIAEGMIALGFGRKG